MRKCDGRHCYQRDGTSRGDHQARKGWKGFGLHRKGSEAGGSLTVEGEYLADMEERNNHYSHRIIHAFASKEEGVREDSQERIYQSSDYLDVICARTSKRIQRGRERRCEIESGGHSSWQEWVSFRLPCYHVKQAKDIESAIRSL